MTTNQPVKPNSVNLLPFSVEYDGPAPISKYFHVTLAPEGYSSQFRGRELKGIEIDVPCGVSGYIVSSNADDKRRLELGEKFNELTFWEHDFPPNETTVKEALDWFAIARSIHSDNPELET